MLKRVGDKNLAHIELKETILLLNTLLAAWGSSHMYGGRSFKSRGTALNK